MLKHNLQILDLPQRKLLRAGRQLLADFRRELLLFVGIPVVQAEGGVGFAAKTGVIAGLRARPTRVRRGTRRCWDRVRLPGDRPPSLGPRSAGRWSWAKTSRYRSPAASQRAAALGARSKAAVMHFVKRRKFSWLGWCCHCWNVRSANCRQGSAASGSAWAAASRSCRASFSWPSSQRDFGRVHAAFAAKHRAIAADITSGRQAQRRRPAWRRRPAAAARAALAPSSANASSSQKLPATPGWPIPPAASRLTSITATPMAGRAGGKAAVGGPSRPDSTGRRRPAAGPAAWRQGPAARR